MGEVSPSLQRQVAPQMPKAAITNWMPLPQIRFRDCANTKYIFFTLSRFRHLLRFVAFFATPSAGSNAARNACSNGLVLPYNSASYEVTRRASVACDQRPKIVTKISAKVSLSNFLKQYIKYGTIKRRRGLSFPNRRLCPKRPRPRRSYPSRKKRLWNKIPLCLAKNRDCQHPGFGTRVAKHGGRHALFANRCSGWGRGYCSANRTPS